MGTQSVPFHKTHVGRSWLIPAAGVAAFLLAFWPLFAFQRRWTTTGPVSCAAVPSGASSCSYDLVTGTWSGTWIETARHSAISPLGIGLTVAWLAVLTTVVALGLRAAALRARRG